MKQQEFLEIIEQNKGKHRPSLETLIQGRNGIQRDPIPVVIATDDTNLPLMNIARTYGWIKQDATKFYESEANDVTDITIGIVNTFVNTHTQETVDTPYGTFTRDLWYDKDGNKWYDTTGLIGGGDFSLTNISFKIIRPIKSQDDETASLYERIYWTDIEHFNEFKYFTSVRSIDDGVFAKCDGLTSITIPDSVTFIDVSAFDNCSSLTSVTIPDSVTSISASAFYGCSNLTSVTIGNGVVRIGENAFSNCTNLTSITIPDNVISIGTDAFKNCNSLPIIDNIRYADTYVVEATDKALTEYIIKNDIKWIGENAFSNCTNLTSITIPDSVTSISGGAFSNCTNLTSIVIPDSITSIGYGTFQYCSSLTSVTIPDSVTSIGQTAFAGCRSLRSITIPNSVTTISEDAFEQCSGLISIIVESGNTKYDSRNNCNAIIETSTNILIFGCMNTIIPNSVTCIRRRAFYYCTGLTSITIPNSIINIESNAFYGCSNLASVIIPNSVTSIGNYAFAVCTGLTSITIGNSVTNIGEYAFFNCTGLTSIICNAITAPIIRNNTFQNIKTGGILTVPAGSTQYGGWISTSNYYLGKYNWTKIEQ